MHQALGISRVVLVQPSVYGSDNACLLQAITQLGLDSARGIAVVDLKTISEAELLHLHQNGVRGIRLNLHVNGVDLQEVRAQIKAAKRITNLPGWHLQVHASMDIHVSMLGEYLDLGAPVVLDHFAGGTMPDSESDGLMAQLANAMRNGPIYVKLSAAYRLWTGCSSQTLTQLFYSVAPEQIIWGSDWPHTGGAGGRGRNPQVVEPFRQVDNSLALERVLRSIGSPQAAQKILVDNPARLYGFSN
jgi:predicted TIM-barrel fold metal-dependent hydrolase